MKELTQVRDVVMKALTDTGLRVIAAFPDGRAKQYEDAVVTVAVGAAEGKTMGFCNYLGEVYDPEQGMVLELYGKQLEGEIAVDVRADRAAVCEQNCEMATEVLLGGLPGGIRPGELNWEALVWDKATGMFLRRGKLKCQATFVAKGTEDGEMFLDFILKGVMTD